MDEKEKKYQETFETWNKVADLYQENFMHLDLYNDSYDLFCSMLSQQKPSILEIGCGPGNITQYLLSKKPAAKWLGIDIAARMIELARINNPAAFFQVMDSRKLHQLTDQYDAIVAGFCIPYLSNEDCLILYSEMYRLMQTGALLYMSFVAGDYNLSNFQTGSSGDRTYFYYHPIDGIKRELMIRQFEICQELEITYNRKNGQAEIHTILIVKKQ